MANSFEKKRNNDEFISERKAIKTNLKSKQTVRTRNC